ncbi:M23 family metallopeptidase [Denitromonas ohlonensis]|jgi:murein DD-endopeptidase MepM/ murein hydrolase activator NlpD|uniref:M23 family metallopeptidase n=2 Tax=Denitromonas TaxID=139331 RepID=A0A557RER8_9RHOO|nr:M23 family metallopeptidase [Denitromonas ohlonensis]TVO74186.1 M23 family metallopeptidase [Denitromonas ohlonensis]TVT48775.1 MAG: M23 family metallopeptidase [Denitromonas halophila]TVT70387.1 MAG: M23 family metallopeptidase [Denitromonas halophila]
MAFVILSAKALTQSKVRTVSGRTFLLGVSAAILLTLASGIWLGTRLVEPPEPILVATVDEAAVSIDAPEDKFVIDRLGELTGRLFRLESDAKTLANRVGVLNAFERRLKGSAAPGVAKTGPAGGPMIPPIGEAFLRKQAFDFSSAQTGLDQLEDELARLDQVLSSIDERASTRKLSYMIFPSRPPVTEGRRSSVFGNRYDPFTGRRAFHSGQDFAAPSGTPIRASAGGKVIEAGYHREYGNKVEIDHGNGLVTRYAHASKLYVKEGDVVTPGQKIATVGSTGRSTGPHLHFEILENGEFVDPVHYLAGS